MNRITRHDLFMSMAELVARRGTCPRAQVGAVIVRDNRVISMGYNGAPSGFPHCGTHGCFDKYCPTCNSDRPNSTCVACATIGCQRSVHAEANAIAFAAKDGIQVLGASLYVTHEVCSQCARLLVNSGIAKVYYLHEYWRDSGLHILKSGRVYVCRLTDEERHRT